MQIECGDVSRVYGFWMLGLSVPISQAQLKINRLRSLIKKLQVTAELSYGRDVMCVFAVYLHFFLWFIEAAALHDLTVFTPSECSFMPFDANTKLLKFNRLVTSVIFIP